MGDARIIFVLLYYCFRTTGKSVLPLTAPDTITSWVATAFAANKETGFGLTDKAEKVRV